MSPEEIIADRIFKVCVLDECDGLWFDRMKAAAIILQTMAEKDAQIAALTQRAEQAEAAVDANWVTHQQVIAANNRAFAAKAREKRLREGIEALHRTSRSHSTPGIDRRFVTQELAALLAQDGVVNGVESALNTAAALPAAGDERWEKLRSTVKAKVEYWKGMPSAVAAYSDIAKYIEEVDEIDRLSTPPQEAGDDEPK